MNLSTVHFSSSGYKRHRLNWYVCTIQFSSRRTTGSGCWFTERFDVEWTIRPTHVEVAYVVSHGNRRWYTYIGFIFSRVDIKICSATKRKGVAIFRTCISRQSSKHNTDRSISGQGQSPCNRCGDQQRRQLQ